MYAVRSQSPHPGKPQQSRSYSTGWGGSYPRPYSAVSCRDSVEIMASSYSARFCWRHPAGCALRVYGVCGRLDSDEFVGVWIPRHSEPRAARVGRSPASTKAIAESMGPGRSTFMPRAVSSWKSVAGTGGQQSSARAVLRAAPTKARALDRRRQGGADRPEVSPGASTVEIEPILTGLLGQTGERRVDHGLLGLTRLLPGYALLNH